MRKIKIIFLLIAFFSLLVFLAHFWMIGSSIWGDSRYYYSYLPSLVIKRNLRLETGNKYSIGPALFWLPFFLPTHLLSHGSGYELPYQLVVGLASGLFGVLGLCFCFLTAKKYFGEKIALLATIGIWLGSNLFFYTGVDPVNSHSLSFFVSSLLVYIWLGGLWRIRILGVLVGILGMIRTQDLIFVIPLVSYLRDRRRITNFLLGVFWGFLPQLVVWQIIFGELRSPYLIYGHQFFWLQPKIMEVLFSRENGLFYYSPILILGLLGLVGAVRKKFWARAGIFLFFSQLYIIGSWFMWWGGAGYGGRMFISLMPFFILGLAKLMNKTKKYLGISIIIIISFIILNFYSMIKFLVLSP